MPDTGPTLHLICGKIASGKSTLAAQLAAADKTVLIVEDDWLAELYGDQMQSLADYVRCVSRLRDMMGPHVAALLSQGLSVVLDCPANTVDTRRWMRQIIDQSRAAHALHLLMPPDELCLERLKMRNASGEHPFQVSEEQFHQMSKHFVPPAPEEGFNVVVHDSVSETTGKIISDDTST